MLPNSQLRMHYQRNFFHKIRFFRHYLRGVLLGKNIIIEDGVKLLRFPKNIKIGDDVIIKSGSHLCPCKHSALLEIGARTTVGFNTLIYASCRISIGDDCMIAPFVYIVDSDHGIERKELMNRQDNYSKPIIVGSDVWIGAHAVILKGVTLGDGAVVAAGSVVRENVLPYTIVGGVPARVIGERE